MGTRPKVISLFSGCGGSSLGYKWAGFDELLAIDFDRNSVETFKLNFPDVPVWQRDICKISGKEIVDFCGIKEEDLDLLDASPPCQGFSIVGKRKVMDTRNSLFLELVRLIKEIRPKTFLMENVPGMMRGRMKGKFIEIMEALKGTGYDVKCKLMNAKYYNVPQSRQRLIWIGVRKDLNIQPSFPEPSNKLITVKRAIGHLEESEKDKRKRVTKGLERYAYRLREGESVDKYHRKGSLFGLKRISRHKPCCTILRSAGTGLLHYEYNLFFLSIKELQVLSSFPEDFIFIGPQSSQIDRIGNTVMPRFMEAVAAHIKEEIL